MAYLNLSSSKNKRWLAGLRETRWGTGLYPRDGDVSTVSSHLIHTRYNAYCTVPARFLSEFTNSQLICRETYIPQPPSTDNTIPIIMEYNDYSPTDKLHDCKKLGHWFAKAGPWTCPTREQFPNRPVATPLGLLQNPFGLCAFCVYL